MPKGKTIILLILFLPLCSFSQTAGKLPVSTILKQIAVVHGIKFSRLDNDIAMYTLVPPGKGLSLTEKIEYIEKRTRLRFERTSNNYYIVYNAVSAEKPLCGYIMDAKTGNPVQDAFITLQGQSETVYSNNNGYFSLHSVKGILYISHVGYKPMAINIADMYVPGCPALYLEEFPIQLEEVVAQRYLANGISKKESGELVIKPQKFGVLPGLTEPDLLQTMQQLPGVISIDETVSNINVRGGTHDQNLFLWNGIRMFQTSHFFGLISAFNPLQATSISIYKNGTPAFYGESVSAFIDIAAQAPQDSTYTAVTADMLTVNALSAIKLSQKDRLQVAVRRSFSDIVTTPTFKSYQQRIFQNTTVRDVLENQNIPVKSIEDFYFYDASFSFTHKINDKHKFMINGIGIENNLTVFQKTDSAQRNDNLSQKTFGGSITLVSTWNENTTSEIQAYASAYKLRATNEAIENNQETQQGNTVADKGMRLKYTYIVSPKITFSTGYQFNEISITNFDEVNVPVFSKNEKLVSRSHALIAEGSYRSKSGLTKLTAGIREGYFEKYNRAWAEPRAAFSTQLIDGLRLELLAEKKSQTVSQIIEQQQDFLGIEKRRWVLADGKNIPVQKSSQASAGFNYSKNGWYVSLEGFYKKVDGITSNSQDFQNQFEFTDSKGYYKVLGYEFLLQKRVGHFYSWISYTYNDNHYHFYSFVPPGFSNNFAIPHAVTAAGSYEWNTVRMALGAKWRSGTPVTEPVSFYIDPDNPANSKVIYGNPNNKRLNDNLQLNFSLSNTWALGSHTYFTTSGSVLNILDRKNNIGRYYRINKGNNNIESINTYGLRCTPNISIKIIF